MIDKFKDHIFYLAYQSIKKDKRSYIISFIVMIIAFTFTIVFTTYINTRQTTDKLLNYQKFGKWNICYEGLNETSIDLLSDANIVDLLVNQQVTKEFDDLTYMSNYNEEFFTMAYIKLEEGSLPSSNHEIIASISDHQINDEVLIDGESYKVVGLFTDYDKYWDTHSYKYFSYHLPSIKSFTYVLLETFNPRLLNLNDSKPIYNNRLQDLSVKRYSIKSNNVYYSEPTNTNTNNRLNVYLDSMNMFTLLMGAAIFVAIEYNSNKRESTIFLLRCIGMNKKDMKKYIFYEIILVMLMALAISLVIGLLLSFIVCYVMSLSSGIFAFGISISLSIRYILYLIGLILLTAYISIVTISIRSMDSLIQKKNRTQLKKYNKSQRMSIRRLAGRLSQRYPLLVTGIILLFNVQYFTVFSIMDYADTYLHTFTALDHIEGYHYLVHSEQSVDLSHLDDYILDKEEYKFIEGEASRGNNLDTNMAAIYLFDFDSIEYEISDGRKVENKNEIYVYKPLSYGFYNEQYLNEKFKMYEIIDEYVVLEDGSLYFNGESQREEIGQYTSVGRLQFPMNPNIQSIFANRDNYYDFYSVLPHEYIRTYAIDESNISASTIKYSTYIRSNKDLNYPIMQLLSNEQSTYTVLNSMMFEDYINQDKSLFAIMMLSPILLISVIFMIFIIHLTVNNIDKDIRLLRCIGMTFKQSMLLYMFIFGFIIIISLLYVGAYLSMLERTLKWVVLIPSIINPLIAFIIIYHKTSHSLVFYPTDVERYY